MLKGREKKEKKEDRRYLLLCRYNRSTLGRIVVVLHSDAIPSPSIISLSATPLTLPLPIPPLPSPSLRRLALK